MTTTYDPPGRSLPPAVWVGVAARLRQARRAVGLDPEAAARAVGVGTDEILAVESARPDAFPSGAEALCCVYSYASLLDLPADRFVEDLVAGWDPAPTGGGGGAAAPAESPEVTQQVPVIRKESWWDRVAPADDAPTGELPVIGPLIGLGPPATRSRRGIRRAHPRRRLRNAVAATGAAVVMATGGVLVTGVGAAPGAKPSRAAAGTAAGAPALLTPAASGSTSASYTLPAGPFTVEVTASYGSWVQIHTDSGSWSGVLAAGASRSVRAVHSAWVDVGAGGTTITVTAGSRSQPVRPPSAPYTVAFSAP